MEPVVHLRGAVALLGRFPALAGANLDVQRGEIVLVRGRNGAGKTTLLRVLAGLLPVAAGDAVVQGCDLRARRQDVRTKVGMLGHGNGLYEDLTVTENVRFWGRTVGATDAEIATAMERLGVGGRLAGVPVHRLSAGQRRRTALAVVAARRPELWLLDEPHAGLDAAGRELLDALLRAAALVAGKDLRIEARSRVATNQVIPFAFCMLLVFAFALDPARGTLTTAAPGLFWVAVLFPTVLGAQRSFGVDQADGTRDALRLSGLDPAGVFLGKAGALALQLLVLEVLLGVGVLVLYTTDLRASGIILLVV